MNYLLLVITVLCFCKISARSHVSSKIRQRRIIAGQSVLDKNEYPFIASLQMQDTFQYVKNKLEMKKSRLQSEYEFIYGMSFEEYTSITYNIPIEHAFAESEKLYTKWELDLLLDITDLDIKNNAENMKFHYCGASVIANRWLITASHCVIGDGETKKRLQEGFVALGGHNLKQQDEFQRYNVVKTVCDSCISRDFCLLKLDRDTNTHPIAINTCPVKELVKKNTVLTALGWGSTVPVGFDRYNADLDEELNHEYDEPEKEMHLKLLIRQKEIQLSKLSSQSCFQGTCFEALAGEVKNRFVSAFNRNNIKLYGMIFSRGGQTPILQKVNLKLQSKAECQKVEGIRNDDQFCAGNKNTKADTCQGDSGGPVIRKATTGENVLTGVVSMGDGCGVIGSYGMYTDVGVFADFIKSHIPQNELNFIGCEA